MQAEPTALRVDDPGIRALFSEESRFQFWLDVETALAEAQAELGVIPEKAAVEIARKAKLSYIDLDAVHAGLRFRRIWVFNIDVFDSYWWEYDNDDLKLMQVRFYPSDDSGLIEIVQ